MTKQSHSGPNQYALFWTLTISSILHLALMMAPTPNPAPQPSHNTHKLQVHISASTPSTFAVQPIRQKTSEETQGQPSPPIPIVTSNPWAKAYAKYYETSELDVLPAPLSEITPQYPDKNIRDRANRTVHLDLFLDEEGNVVAINKRNPDENQAFYEAAEAAFKSAKFSPAFINGTEVKSHLKITVHFDTPPAE